MAIWEKPGFGLIAGGLLGGPLGALGGGLIQNQFQQSAEQRRAAEQAEFERKYGRERQLSALQGMQAPSTSALMQRRIQALDESSREVPLSQDPYFQADRARLLGSGARELSAIQNVQRATGARGGFSNIGSPQDVQDRLSIAMAQLGQQARVGRDERLAEAARLQQGLQDAETEFVNARQRAIAAIESGDTGLALQNLQQAAQMRQQILQGQQQLYGNLLAVGGQAAGRLATGGAAG